MDTNRFRKAPEGPTRELPIECSFADQPRAGKPKGSAIARSLAIAALGLWVGSAVTSVVSPRALAFAASPVDDSPGDEGPNDPNSPDSPDPVGGHWSGTIIDDSNGAGTLDFTVQQRKGRVSGGFDISFQSSSEDMAGSFKGSIKGSDLKGGLHPNRPRTCSITIEATDLNQTELKGTYKPVNPAACNGAKGGTFDLQLEHS